MLSVSECLCVCGACETDVSMRRSNLRGSVWALWTGGELERGPLFVCPSSGHIMRGGGGGCGVRSGTLVNVCRHRQPPAAAVAVAAVVVLV